MDFSFLAVALTAALGLALAWLLLAPRRLRCWRRLPPGPIGWPVLGSLAALDAKTPHLSLAALAERYGRDSGMFSVQLGSVFAVVLTEPRLVRAAFAKDTFAGRPPLYFTLGVLGGQGLISAADELWKDQRKQMMIWMRVVGAARGSVARPKFAERFVAMADRMEKKINSLDMSNIDVQDVFLDVLGTTVNELVFGVTYHVDDPVWKWMLNIQEEGVKCMGVSAILNFLPFLRFFIPSLNTTRDVMLLGQAQTHQIIEEIVKIRKRRLMRLGRLEHDVSLGEPEKVKCKHYTTELSSDTKTHDERGACTFDPARLVVHDDDCILDYYLEEQEKRRLAGDLEGLARLSDRQLNYFLCDLFGASLDTTANTIIWFLLYIAVHPGEQDLIRSELRDLCGNFAPTLNDMPNANYTRAAICEIQRLCTVVPLGIPHGAIEDTTLNGYFIPKDTMIMPFQWYMHNDRKVWDEPDKFKPSRFLSSDGTLLSPEHFMPFQTGKRICPGEDFARMELFVFISRLISKYEFSLSEPLDDMTGHFGLTYSPPKFKLKARPLLSKVSK